MMNRFQCSLIISVIFLSTSYSIAGDLQQEVDELFEKQREIRLENKNRLNKKDVAPATDAVTAGKAEFMSSCAVCHGTDAKGRGHMASQLVIKPADLTQLKLQNNGVFPFLDLYRTIEGVKDVDGHGTREMPVWGKRFKSEQWLQVGPEYQDRLVRGRITELLFYIDSIQIE